MNLSSSSRIKHTASVLAPERQVDVLSPHGPAVMKLDGQIDSFISSRTRFLPVTNLQDLDTFLKDPQIAKLRGQAQAGRPSSEFLRKSSLVVGRSPLAVNVVKNGSGVDIKVGLQTISVGSNWAKIHCNVPFKERSAAGNMEQTIKAELGPKGYFCTAKEYNFNSIG